MSRRLYVFVDESGTHHRGECYTVAGCWCVSERTNPEAVLSATKDRLIGHANEMRPQAGQMGELKGAALKPTEVSALVANLQDVCFDDTTITLSPVPWSSGWPIRFSVFDLNPDIAKPVVTDVTGNELQAPQTIQGLALTAVLNPVFFAERVESELVDRIHVVLDATVWKRSARRVRNSMENASNSIGPFSFSTVDSTAIPGIQLADIAAYSWRRNLLAADCENAIRALADLRFPRFA